MTTNKRPQKKHSPGMHCGKDSNEALKPLPVDIWDIERIAPYEKNAKIHSPEQVEKLANNIREFGWDQPIVVDGSGVIIKGHGRHLAAKHLGLKKVPVVVRDDLTEAQVKAARLADNRVASTNYDTTLLQAELSEISLDDLDMSDLGFDSKELEFLTSDLGEMNEDVFTGDLTADVLEQAQKNAEKIEKLSKEDIPLSKAFGFKSVPATAEKTVFRFMAIVEEQTGLTGSEAFVYWVAKLMEESDEV